MSGGRDQASHACCANSCRYGSSHHGTRHSPVRDIVAQRMDAARLLDAGLFLGQVVHVRRTVAAQRSARDGAREQPMGRAHAAPVGAQLLQQPGREWHVAVLASLALLDPQEHAPGIDVGHAQARQFAAPKPGGVGGHRQGTVLGVGRHREQPQQFVAIEDLGQGWRVSWRRADRSAARATRA